MAHDSTQIFEYLEDRYPQPPHRPQSVAGRALARRFELEPDEVVFPHLITLIKERRGNADAGATRPHPAIARRDLPPRHRGP